MKKKIKTEAAKIEAFNRLVAEGARGAPICAAVKSVSRSGMSRRIEFYCLLNDKDGKPAPWRIGYLIAAVIGRSYDIDKGGIRVNDCGMDMVFHAISTFNYAAARLDNPGVEFSALSERYGRIYDSYFFDANKVYSL